MPQRFRSHLSPVRPSWRILPVVLALAVVAYAFTVADQPGPAQSDPAQSGPAQSDPAKDTARLQTWRGAAPSTFSARLSDGTAYEPRIFVTATSSVGLALTVDGSAWRILSRVDDRVTELRRIPAVAAPQVNGVAVDGDTVVWAESLTGDGTDPHTTIWQANWATGGAKAVTSDTGNASFSGVPDDLVLSGGRISWAARLLPGDTEIRSVALAGGTVSARRLSGTLELTTAPWAVTPGTGHGRPIQLVNLATAERITVATDAGEIGTCGPVWCAMVLVANTALIRIDLQHPDGSQRRRVAGANTTPIITDVALLDRFIPLKIDQPGDREAGLALYDIQTSRTTLIDREVDHVQGAGAFLWWSTGDEPAPVWHALDLRGPA